MANIPWERYPSVAQCKPAREWLEIQANLQLRPNTIKAYGFALEDYLSFCARGEIEVEQATKAHLAKYVQDLTTRPSPRGPNVIVVDSGAGLSNATIQQRLTAVRLYYDFLVEESIRKSNPVGRGKYTPGKAFGGKRARGLVRRFKKLPWIPTEEQWQSIVVATKKELLRNQVMLSVAYDAALRREELCSLEISDFDFANRMLTIRPETTKTRQGRKVPYSVYTGKLLRVYLRQRYQISRKAGAMFLSESRRNYGSPAKIHAWSKVVERISECSGIRQLSTHTFRHLCLTDLARAGRDVLEIAKFAGHRSLTSTFDYIHLSGRDLAKKLQDCMNEIHAQRSKMMMESFVSSDADGEF